MLQKRIAKKNREKINFSGKIIKDSRFYNEESKMAVVKTFIWTQTSSVQFSGLYFSPDPRILFVIAKQLKVWMLFCSKHPRKTQISTLISDSTLWSLLKFNDAHIRMLIINRKGIFINKRALLQSKQTLDRIGFKGIPTFLAAPSSGLIKTCFLKLFSKLLSRAT